MNLRTIIEADLATVMESEQSVRWPITITDPSGNTHTEPLYAVINDISTLIDPETGQLVSGRTVSAAIRISSLKALGFGIPIQVSGSLSRPWLIEFKDMTGVSHVMKVMRGDPDLTFGIVNVYLGVYKR